MHDKHLNRPTLDDNDDEEKAIDLLTREITRVNHFDSFLKFHLKPLKIN